MPHNRTLDEIMREQVANDKGPRRYFLRKLIREIDSPGKRQRALSNAERWFDASTLEELQALLDAMPAPRTTTKRGKHARARRESRHTTIESWNDQSVPKQKAGKA